MRVEISRIESELLEHDFVVVSDFQNRQHDEAELRAQVAARPNGYFTIRTSMEAVSNQPLLEELSFKFVECQFRIEKKIQQGVHKPDVSYEYLEIDQTDSMWTQELMNIASSTIVHDRFTLDPLLPEGFSGNRYQAYLRESIESPDDSVWGLISKRSNRLVAFRSYRRISQSEVLLLLGGVADDLKGSGIGVVSAHHCFDQLAKWGFRSAVSHVSAGNLPILNLEIGYLDFRVMHASAVWRRFRPNDLEIK